MTKGIVPIAVFGILTLAACGGSAAPASGGGASAPASGAAASGAPTTPEALAAYKGADRQQILEAGAKKEGTLTWYTSLAGPIVDELAQGFTAKYPYIKVETFRGDESQIMTRALQESQAGKPVFDSVEVTPTTTKLMGEGKLLAPYLSKQADQLPDSLKITAGNGLTLSASDRLTYIGFGYNTKLIPPDAVPKQIEDLMNPALSGKITLAGSTTGHRWAASVLHKMGDEKGKKWLADFASKQKPTVQQVSGKAVMDLIAKGEVPASPTIFRDHMEQARDAGAPVDWVPLEPVVGNAGMVSFDAKAPHPNAGLLYGDFLLGEGQDLLRKEHIVPATDKVPFNVWLPETGRTGAQVEQDAKDWADLFKADFR